MPTAIEWTAETWNPVTGCTRVSPGCAHCYIERQTPMRVAHRQFERVGNEVTTGIRLHPERLARVPKDSPIFVCSMADLFHDEVPFSFIAEVFETMASHSGRIFQVLTKRPERMRDFAWWLLDDFLATTDEPYRFERTLAAFTRRGRALPNVWVGVSVENARYTWRADVLREIPAAVRFISAEPLLGSLYDGGSDARREGLRGSGGRAPGEPAQGVRADRAPRDRVDRQTASPGAAPLRLDRAPLDLTGIDWVIAGGESGPGARPMHPDWARELRDSCTSAQVAFFFKQWGGATPKSGGKLLDGREWNEMPRQAVAV